MAPGRSLYRPRRLGNDVWQLMPFLIHLITVIVAVAVALVLAAVRIFFGFNAPGFFGVLFLAGGLAICFLWQISKLIGWAARKFNSRSQTLRKKVDRFPPAEDLHKRMLENWGIAPPSDFFYLTSKGKKAPVRVSMFRAFPLTHFWLRRKGCVSELWDTRPLALRPANRATVRRDGRRAKTKECQQSQPDRGQRMSEGKQEPQQGHQN